MTMLRALLACVWVLFSLTATAMPAAAQSTEMPCHGDMPDHAPAKGIAVAMPCCSQPVLAAAADPLPLLSRPIEIVRLTPARAAPLASLPARLEPRPPKTV